MTDTRKVYMYLHTHDLLYPCATSFCYSHSLPLPHSFLHSLSPKSRHFSLYSLPASLLTSLSPSLLPSLPPSLQSVTTQNPMVQSATSSTSTDLQAHPLASASLEAGDHPRGTAQSSSSPLLPRVLPSPMADSIVGMSWLPLTTFLLETFHNRKSFSCLEI